MKRIVVLLILSSLVFFSHSLYSQVITGPDTVCVGSVETYSAPSGNSGYSWSLIPATNGSILTTSSNSAVLQWTAAGSELLTVSYLDLVTGVTVTINKVVTIVDKPNPMITYDFAVACVDSASDAGGGNPQGGKDRVECILVCDSSITEFTTPNTPGSTYLWKALNGTIVGGVNTNNNVFVLWDQLGVGFVRVIETNVYGCVDSVDLCVEVIEGPDASFTKPKSSLCLEEQICFANTSAGAVSYFWDFGDGGISFDNNPCYKYYSPGTYTVTLIAYNECNCTDTFSCDIIVDPSTGPEVECISTVCAGDCVTYSTPESCSTYNWYVPTGEGTIVSGLGTNSIEVCWGNGPVGHICLEVIGCTSGSLCPDTVCYTVPIIPPSLNVAGPTIVCPNSVEEYSIPCFPGSKVTWSVSGGVILEGDSTSEITVQWGSGPTGSISVTVTNDFLDCSSSGILSVNIKPKFQLIPDFLDVCPGDFTTFITLTSGTFDWTVKNSSNTIVNQVLGVSGGSFTENWVYGTGTFYVTASPTNPADFCISSLTATINVIYVPPVDTIIGDSAVCPGTPYPYSALTPAAGTHLVWSATNGTVTNPNGNPTFVSWNKNSGPYTLSVVQVLNAAPFCTSAVYSTTIDSFLVAGPVVTGSGACVNQTSTFNATAVSGATLYNWSLSNPALGSIISGQGSQSITVQWNNTGGGLNVVCSVDICNHSVSGFVPVTINGNPSISMPDNWYCENSTGTLTVSPSGLTYAWDPAPALGQTTQTATGLTEGTYTVTVTDLNSCQSIASAFLQEIPAPVANITTPDPLSYCIPNPVNTRLYATDGGGYTFNWSSGAGNPNVVTSPGTYTLTVTGPGPYFCTDVTSITVSQDTCVSDTPCIPVANCQVSFTATPTAQCNVWNFTNTSNASNYSWNFGDPFSNVNTGTITNASHTYSEAGYYTVSLSGDCPNSNPPPAFCTIGDSRVITVNAAADLEVITGCVGAISVFNDLSTFLSGTSISQWSWSFPGGSPSSVTNFSDASVNVVYASAGSYSATLTVTHSSGCTSTKTIPVIIDPLPDATFTFAPSPVCLGQATQFTHSFPSGIINWSWTFPTATSGGTMPWYTFTSPGLQPVSLTVTNSNGCSNSSTQNVNVFPPSTGNIMPNKPVVDTCKGDSIKLTAPAGSGYSWSTGETTQIIYAKTTGLYTVTVTDFNGCDFVPDPIFVIIHPLPNAIIEGPTEACEFESFTLNGPVGGATYNWEKIGTGPVGSGLFYTPGYLAPGVHQYQLEVIDINGCSAKSPIHTITIHPSLFAFIAWPPPVCEFDPVTLTVSAFGGTSPYMYNWSNGGTGISTTVFLEGNYGVTVTDANGCKTEASAPVVLNPLPDFCLLPTGCLETCFPDTICGPVSPIPGYYANYEWLQLDANCDPIGVVSTNQNFVVTAPGKYALVITTNTSPVCADTSDPMEIVELPCDDSCYAYYDSAYKKIFNDITISTTTVFSGKYYVDDDVIITVNNGATLDLTNVDMVFGKCAGIDFLDGSTVRANNSVFRPCNLTESWRGFEFRDGSGGIIDECVYKNAQRALIFWGTSAQSTDARVMNNFFYNCKMNVVSVNGTFNEPITGNTFIVESSNIVYDRPGCPVYIPYSSQHWGVIGYFSDFTANVSQNDFIHASDPNNSKRFIGVYLVRGSGIFSENKFTNMYRSFDLQSARNSSIENNEIEITQQFTAVQNQIRGSLCTNMFILSNEIEDTYEYRSFVTNSSAIYFSSGSGLQIKENRIEGFSNGIVLLNTTSANIIENNIFNSNQYGIYLSNARNTDVSCNSINMDDIFNTIADEVGIGHIQTTLTNSNNVYRNNCIMETDVAMYFSAPAPPAGSAYVTLPQIVNNYLYSYNDYGVQIFNFDGNIGSAAGSFATGGRNTFVSNNVPNGSVDISSNPVTINEAGNFGINLLVNVNSLGPKNAYYSTASCGHQIDGNLNGVTPNPGQEITQIERCDPTIIDVAPIAFRYGEDVNLDSDFVTVLEEFPSDGRFELMLSMLTAMANNQTDVEIQNLLYAAHNSDLLASDELKWLDYYASLYSEDYNYAYTLLQNLPKSTIDEYELHFIESVVLDLIMNDKDVVLLDEQTKIELTTIDDRRGKYASVARDLLHMAEGDHNFLFEELQAIRKDKHESSELLQLNPELLEVFPNPAKDEVIVKYFVEDIDNTKFYLYSISGTQIYDINWNYSGSRIKLSLQDLSAGVYMFVIDEKGSNPRRAKIVKN